MVPGLPDNRAAIVPCPQKGVKGGSASNDRMAPHCIIHSIAMAPPPEIRVMPNAARILGGDSTVNNKQLNSENDDSGGRGAHVDSETKPKRVVGRLLPNRTQATPLLSRGSMVEMRRELG